MRVRYPHTNHQTLSIKPEHDYRLRTDKVGTNGKTTLRWGSKLRRLYIGRRWGGGTNHHGVCIDNHVDIKITATGAQIAAYTLTEEKIYYNKKDNELNPSRGNQKQKSRDTDRNDVSRLPACPREESNLRHRL